MDDKEMTNRNESTVGAPLKRRRFLEKSGALAGGITLAGAASPFVHAAGSSTLKLAVIGCGGRGRGAMRQAVLADPGLHVVAVADAFADRAQECAKIAQNSIPGHQNKLTSETIFSGLDAYRKAIDLADVVVLATPPGFRPEHFEYAVQRGKHVFMEKPVATDAPGIRRVLRANEVALAKGLNVVVGLQRRYQPCYQEVVKRYRNGDAGEIVSGQVFWNSGGVWVREREPGQTELEYQMRNWYYFNWLCGDHILEQHIHNIDVANWLLDAYPESAQGMGGREVRAGKDHGQIFDHHFVEFTYPNGVVISSQCRHQPGCFNRVEEQFQTTTGGILTSEGNKGIISVRKTGGTRENAYEHRGMFDKSAYQIEHDELFKAIRSGEVINNAEYGAKSTLSAIMGRMATYSGQVIDWNMALESNLALVPNSIELDWEGPAPVMPDRQGRYPVAVPGVTSFS